MELLVNFHTAILFAFLALQFHAGHRSAAGEFEKPSGVWLPLCRALTIAALAAVPVGLYLDSVVAHRVAFASMVIAVAGIARLLGWEALTRWNRWIELAAWCLCILAVCASIAVLIVLGQNAKP